MKRSLIGTRRKFALGLDMKGEESDKLSSFEYRAYKSCRD